MRRNLSYLFKLIISTQFIIFLCPIIFHVYLMYGYDHPRNSLFVMLNQFTLFISAVSFLILFLRAYINSMAISINALLLTGLFYLNVNFEFIDVTIISAIYFVLMTFSCIVVSMKCLLTMQEIHQVEGLKELPKYDCMEVSLLSNPEDIYEFVSPYEKYCVKFKFHYRHCYAYGGNIYYKGKKYLFSNVNYYVNEQKTDINHLSLDDFNVISMIFI